MAQTTRGSIEEGSAQFQNQDYKDVTFDTNSAGRSHRGQVAIKVTGVNMAPYDNPVKDGAILSTWTATSGVFMDTTIQDSSASSDYGTPIIKSGTAVLRFEEDSAPYDATLTTTSKIQAPKYRISWRAAESYSLVADGGYYGGTDDFNIQISPDGSSWTNVASPVYRKYGADNFDFVALSDGNGILDGGSTHTTRFYWYYIDVDQSGQHEKANFLRFYSNSTTANDGIIIHDLTISSLVDGQDSGLSNANIGISFTNITSTGFRIELSSKLTGYVRYLISAYE